MKRRLPATVKFCCHVAWPDVPLPPKKSSTIPSGSHPTVTILCRSRTGFGFGNGDLVPSNNLASSFVPSSVCPTLSKPQMVCGGMASLTSERKRLNLGLLLPASPNQIRLSLKSSAIFSLLNLQLLPFGGQCCCPFGAFNG